MQIVLAIVSFFAAVFLPGAIIYRLIWREKFRLSLFLVVSFLGSLFVNFWLIYALIASGFYTQAVVITLFGIEILWCVYLYRMFYKLPPLYIQDKSTLGFVISALLLIYIVSKMLNPDIFYGWDAVVSWDRWATQWAQGEFILNPSGYPQLYPMLLSLGYVATQMFSSFQAIGGAIYWYFSLVGIGAAAFLCTNAETSYRASIFGTVLGVVVYYVFFMLHHEFNVGYADAPVAMMILISALCLLQVDFIESSNTKTNTESALYLLIGAMAAGISAEIKQAGLFWCVVYVLGVFYLFWLHPRFVSKKIILYCALIVAVLCLPWIIIAIYKKTILHTNATNVDWVMDGIYFGASKLERLIAAITKYKAMSALFLLSLLGLTLKRRIFGFLGLFGFVYFLCWGMLLSYDMRNLQGGMPLMAIALSGVLCAYSAKALILIKKVLCFGYQYMVLGLVVLAVFGSGIAYVYQDKILAKEYKRKMRLGGAETNQMLFEAMQEYGEKPVLTGNQLLQYVPAFDRSLYRHFSFGGYRYDEQERLTNHIAEIKEKEFYILIPTNTIIYYESFFSQPNIRQINKNGTYELFLYTR